MRSRLKAIGSPQAFEFISTLLDANADFMAYAVSPSGALAGCTPTEESIGACFRSLLIYSVNLFARDQLASDHSELAALLAQILEMEPEAVMLRRDALRKAPKGEEWMLYAWLRRDLGMAPIDFDTEIERQFGYQYVSYIKQYQRVIGKMC